MKINTLDNQPARKSNIQYYILAVLLGFVTFLLFSGFVELSKVIINFIKLYWHFVIIGAIALLFLKRWFKKKEIVIQKVPEYYNNG